MTVQTQIKKPQILVPPCRNLPIAPRECKHDVIYGKQQTANIHVKTANRLESLHYFNVPARRKITVAKFVVGSLLCSERFFSGRVRN